MDAGEPSPTGPERVALFVAWGFAEVPGADAAWRAPGGRDRVAAPGGLTGVGSCAHIFSVFRAVKTGQRMVQVLPRPRTCTPSCARLAAVRSPGSESSEHEV